MLTQRLRRLCWTWLLLCAPALAADDLAAERAAAAATPVLIRARGAQAAQIEALRTYPLYPYLQAARLQRLLADAPAPLPDQQVGEEVGRGHACTPDTS